MAIETSNDLDYFFDSSEFAVAVTFISPPLGTVVGSLDGETRQIDVGGNEIDAEVITFTAKTASLDGVKEGSTLQFGSDYFAVKDRMDDGTGLTDLELIAVGNE